MKELVKFLLEIQTVNNMTQAINAQNVQIDFTTVWVLVNLSAHYAKITIKLLDFAHNVTQDMY